MTAFIHQITICLGINNLHGLASSAYQPSYMESAQISKRKVL